MTHGALLNSASDRRWAKPAGRKFGLRLTGLLYILVTMLLVVAGVNSQNNLLFIAFGLGIAGLLLSGFISGAGMMSLRVRRIGCTGAERAALVGADSEYAYSIRNMSRWLPVFAVHLVETLPEGAGEIRAFVPYLAAGKTVRIGARIKAHRRGVFELSRIELWSVFPLGIARKRVWHASVGELVVRPEPVQIQLRSFVRARPAIHQAATSREQRAHAGEFYALRGYVPGDPVRSIAWKRTATLDKPVVPRFAGTPDPELLIRLTLSGRDEAADDEAVAAAIALIEQAAAEQVGVGVLAADSNLAPGSGSAHKRALIRMLCRAEGRSPSLVSSGHRVQIVQVVSRALGPQVESDVTVIRSPGALA